MTAGLNTDVWQTHHFPSFGRDGLGEVFKGVLNYRAN